ncbi:MAG: mechanosensitive ion channel [Bacteroidetes bacterium]|nr:mechanosensitive ion channel [Bacteroidota bacterium]
MRNNMTEYFSSIQGIIQQYGLNVAGAILIFIIGYFASKIIRRAFRKIFEKSRVDSTISSFMLNIIYGLSLTFVALMTLTRLGVETTSFIAVLGAAGLAVGFALKDSLSNFAAGIMLLIFRHFKVGDYIEGGGVAGSVEEIHIFSTKLVTPDNKVIYVPNSSLISGSLTNYSAKETRRVDLVFGIGYGDDIAKAKAILAEILDSDERVLKEPAPQIALSELGDSSVNFVVRPWTLRENYWNLYFDVREKVKLRFDEENITIPFPQRDVHIHNTREAV